MCLLVVYTEITLSTSHYWRLDMRTTQAKLLPGDRVWFRSNGVWGVVVTNHGPAVNTETGNDVITWADGADSVLCA